ncbi:unnamed protein product [Trifolium pratense]|uniref:Uncharacterized protein n=1 Tax=Trifolium pratense TaxID=57577 RepID=A0ACB0LS51_TRIPR|nr:unnamed protein product [Trifolium pratense]
MFSHFFHITKPPYTISPSQIAPPKPTTVHHHLHHTISPLSFSLADSFWSQPRSLISMSPLSPRYATAVGSL